MQSIVLTITLILMAIMAFVFWRAAVAVNADSDSGNVDQRRRVMVYGLLIFGVVVTVASLQSWPHDVSAGNDTVNVRVSGGQWYWEVEAETVPVGKTIVFNMHTEDVNHGFGVINETGRLLFQTQVMPGYVNQVEYVFDEPGTYRVLCMEFCGIGHHDMVDTFDVVASEG